MTVALKQQMSVFVCGCQRSGTTALYEALSRHSALCSVIPNEKELWFFTELFERPQFPAYRSHPLDEMFLNEAVHFIDDFIRRKCASRAGHYVTGHPSNIMIAPSLHALLPHAKFIMLVRDPLETVTSMLNASFAVAAGWRSSSDQVCDGDVATLVEIWRSRARIVLDAYNGRFGDAAKVVRHENLVAKPLQEIASILDFLELPRESEPSHYLASTLKGSSFISEMASYGNNREQFHHNRSQALSMPWAERVYDLSQPESSQLAYELRAPAYKRNAEFIKSVDPEQEGRASATITSVDLINPRTDQPIVSCRCGDDIVLRIRLASPSHVTNASVSFRVHDESGRAVFGTTTFDERHELPTRWQEGLVVEFVFTTQVAPGPYRFDVAVNCVSERDYSDNIPLHQIDEAVKLTVLPSADRPVHYAFNLPVHCSHRNTGERTLATNSDQSTQFASASHNS